MRIWITLDGEAIQLEPLMDDEFQRLFAQALMDWGKISASSSGQHQASDVGKQFLGSKTRVWNLCVSGDSVFNHALDKFIRNALKDVADKFNISIADDMKRKISNGIMIILQGIREVVNPRIVTEGFILTGQISRTKSTLGPCFNTVMQQCFRECSPSEMTHCYNRARDVDISIFGNTGQLTEAQMDESEIPTIIDSSNSTPRDQRPLWNQRATLITATDTVSRWKDFQRKKDPVYLAQLRQAEEDAKLLARHEASEAKKLAKELAKAQDIQRFNSLSKEEQKLEKRRKREENQEKKRAKDEMKRLKLAEAESRERLRTGFDDVAIVTFNENNEDITQYDDYECENLNED